MANHTAGRDRTVKAFRKVAQGHYVEDTVAATLRACGGGSDHSDLVLTSGCPNAVGTGEMSEEEA